MSLVDKIRKQMEDVNSKLASISTDPPAVNDPDEDIDKKANDGDQDFADLASKLASELEEMAEKIGTEGGTQEPPKEPKKKIEKKASDKGGHGDAERDKLVKAAAAQLLAAAAVDDEVNDYIIQRLHKFHEKVAVNIPWRPILTHGLAALVPSAAVGAYAWKKNKDIKERAIQALVADEQQDRQQLIQAYRMGFLRGRGYNAGGQGQ